MPGQRPTQVSPPVRRSPDPGAAARREGAAAPFARPRGLPPGSFVLRAFFALLAVLAAGAACAGHPARADHPFQPVEAKPVIRESHPDRPSETPNVQITGVRVTQGNAVDCPQLRDDEGTLHAVSYLSPTIAIGTRVRVTGFYAVTLACLGPVLVVQEAQVLPD